MSCPFNKESLTQLKTFISLCKSRPELLHIPDLEFFREYIVSLGGSIPEAAEVPKGNGEPGMPAQTPEPSDEEVGEPEAKAESDAESDLELDMDGCIEPDVVDEKAQKMGDPDKEPTEEDIDKADEIKREALGELSNGNFDKAVELFTNAIEVNPKLAILFTKRGQAYLKLNKPSACIRDCTHALELNCDSAPGYKFRGRAYRLIGKWEDAAKDLRQACKIDFDEQADEWLKEVQPNAIKIEQHRLKEDRKRQDKELKERAERVRKAKAANAKAAKEAKQNEAKSGPFESEPNQQDFMSFMQDPEILAAFQDPEVAAAFQDISANPANIIKYQSNPKVVALMKKITGKLGGGGFPMGGFPGMGGMPGMPGGMGANFPPQDDGLDTM